MSQLDAYRTFDGNCAEAMRLYERVLGGKIEMVMKMSESPMKDQCGPGDGDRIMHSSLEVDGRLLMGSDAMGGQPYTPKAVSRCRSSMRRWPRRGPSSIALPKAARSTCRWTRPSGSRPSAW